MQDLRHRQTAFSHDAITLVEAWNGVIGLVLGASFLLLLLAFRSWVIPVKSILMNLLSVLRPAAC
ncbi:MAG: hypothetical protein R2849_18860 [Thermomicrobiales bacterium]